MLNTEDPSYSTQTCAPSSLTGGSSKSRVLVILMLANTAAAPLVVLQYQDCQGKIEDQFRHNMQYTCNKQCPRTPNIQHTFISLCKITYYLLFFIIKTCTLLFSSNSLLFPSFYLLLCFIPPLFLLFSFFLYIFLSSFVSFFLSFLSFFFISF